MKKGKFAQPFCVWVISLWTKVRIFVLEHLIANLTGEVVLLEERKSLAAVSPSGTFDGDSSGDLTHRVKDLEDKSHRYRVLVRALQIRDTELGQMFQQARLRKVRVSP